MHDNLVELQSNQKMILYTLRIKLDLSFLFFRIYKFGQEARNVSLRMTAFSFKVL